MSTPKRILLHLVNSGSSCYLDSLFVVLFCGPTFYFSKRLLLLDRSSNDNEWKNFFIQQLTKLISDALTKQSMCDHYNLRDLLSLKNNNFAKGISNCPSELLQTIAENLSTIDNDLMFNVQVPQTNVWKMEKWPYCLSRWMNFSRFRSSYNYPVLIINATDMAYDQWKFNERFAIGVYKLYAAIIRVDGNHYISIFATKDLVWLEYDDTYPGLYKRLSNSLPTKDQIFRPLSNQSLNGTIMLFYVLENFINK